MRFDFRGASAERMSDQVVSRDLAGVLTFFSSSLSSADTSPLAANSPWR